MARASAAKMAGRWAIPRRALLLAGLATPVAAAAAAPDPALLDQLRFARDVLCPRCDNDIEAEGVNRPMRRVIMAGGAMDAAEQGLEAAIARGETVYRAARPALRQARAALDVMDEERARQALRRAVRIVEAIRTGD